MYTSPHTNHHTLPTTTLDLATGTRRLLNMSPEQRAALTYRELLPITMERIGVRYIVKGNGSCGFYAIAGAANALEHGKQCILTDDLGESSPTKSDVRLSELLLAEMKKFCRDELPAILEDDSVVCDRVELEVLQKSVDMLNVWAPIMGTATFARYTGHNELWLLSRICGRDVMVLHKPTLLHASRNSRQVCDNSAALRKHFMYYGASLQVSPRALTLLEAVMELERAESPILVLEFCPSRQHFSYYLKQGGAGYGPHDVTCNVLHELAQQAKESLTPPTPPTR